MIVLVMLCGFLGLMADTAQLQYVRMRAQTAADAAAVAALHEMRGGNAVSMQAAAVDDAARNGVKGATIQVNCPPLSGEHSGDTTAVEARIVERTPTLFMAIFGHSSVTVLARAVAIADAKGGVTLGE